MKRISLKIAALLCLLLPSCKTIQYVPVKGETITKDSIIIQTKIDTLEVKLPTERIRDWTGLLDTLRMETSFAISTSYVDTARSIISGTLVTKETPVEVYTPSTHTLEKKDSIIYQEVPVPVEVIKEKKIYPKWMIVLSLLGVVSTLILGFIGYLKIKKKLI